MTSKCILGFTALGALTGIALYEFMPKNEKKQIDKTMKKAGKDIKKAADCTCEMMQEMM